MKLKDAFEMVRNKRPEVYPTFDYCRQLLACEQEEFGENSMDIDYFLELTVLKFPRYF